MPWNAALDSLDNAIFGTFGVPAVYADVSTERAITVIIDHDVDLIGEFGQVAESAPVATIAKGATAAPRRDDEIRLANATYIVIRLLSDDGRTLRLQVTPK